MAYGDSGFSLTNTNIVWQIRFPKIVVALMGGGLLACAGYLLQVFFQNPLAGTDLLGINSGASLEWLSPCWEFHFYQKNWE